jgi:hypothetical protein
LIQLPIGARTLAIQPGIDAVTLAVESLIDAVAFLIEMGVNAIALAIQFCRQLIITLRGCYVRAAVELGIDPIAPAIQMLIDAITLGVQPLVDAIALVIEVRLDPVAASIQPVLRDIRVSGGQRTASPEQPRHNRHTRCFSVSVHNASPAKIPDTVDQNLSSG